MDYTISDEIKKLNNTIKKTNILLEKIANNTDKKTVDVIRNGFCQPIEPLRPLKGEFYGPIKRDMELGTDIIYGDIKTNGSDWIDNGNSKK